MTAQPFRLLETMRVERGRCRHLPAHVARMAASADALGFAMDVAEVAAHARTAAATKPVGAWRIRVLVDEAGGVESELLPAPTAKRQLLVGLAAAPIPSTHPLLPHKTTARTHLTALSRPDVDDTLLYNERGELTEFTYGSLVADIGGRLVTPALRCGLLPGVERDRALSLGRVDQGILGADDLSAAHAVWHLNSVRSWTRVNLVR